MQSLFSRRTTFNRAAAVLALCGFACLFGPSALAQDRPAPPPPAAAFFQYPQVLDAQLSPDGRRLALTTAARTGRAALYVFDLQNDKAITQAASFNDTDITRFDWVSNERLTFSVTDLQAGSGESYRVAPGLFSARFDGTELRALVSRRGGPQVTSGAARVALSWNHALLHVPAPKADTPSEEILLGEQVTDGSELRAIVPVWMNVRTGRTRSANIEGPPGGVVGWWFNTAGEPLLALVQNGDRHVLFHRNSPTAAWRQIAEGPRERLPFYPLRVDDDGTLYVSQSRGAEGLRVVKRFDLNANQPEAEPLVSAPGFDFSGSLLGGREAEELGRTLGVRLVSDGETTVWFDPARKALQAAVDAALPGRINRMSCRRCGHPEAVVLVRSFSDQHPGELLLYRPATQAWQRVAQVQPGIDAKRSASLSLERIRARDGRDLPVWITLPAEHTAGQKHPAVVMVHGGPWVRGVQWQWNGMAQFLASRGYVVIEPEFRGSAGYGQAHLRASYKQYGKTMQDDVADALLWAQKQGLASDRACIAGASYGGYSTLMGLARHPELYRCGAAWVALTDLLLYVEGSWWVDDDISDYGRRVSLIERVGNPKVEAERAMLIAQSPIHQAENIKAPVLLAFGEADRRIPIQHGKRMREALEKAGNPPEWITYPGEGHGWRLPANRVDFAERLERFFDKHLK
jgi:acetyl esterase/lipase